MGTLINMNNSNQPIVLLRKIKTRESSTKALLQNITATSSVASLIRSTLGPNAMMKLIVTSMGTTLTNDGSHILRDVEFPAPAARFLVELSRTQEQEAGDGTTSVILLASELLTSMSTLIVEKNIHPTVILSSLSTFLRIAREELKEMSILDEDGAYTLSTLSTTLNSKTVAFNEDFIIDIAKTAFSSTFLQKTSRNWRELIKVEKIPGGSLQSSYIFNGVILKKEPITTRMPVSLTNPKVACVECGLEYPKLQSRTDLELSNTSDLSKLVAAEETYVRKRARY